MLGTGTVSANGSESGYRHGGGALEAAGPMTAHSQPVQKSDGGTRRVQTEAGTLALVTVRSPPVNADHFHTVTRKSLCSSKTRADTPRDVSQRSARRERLKSGPIQMICSSLRSSSDAEDNLVLDVKVKSSTGPKLQPNAGISSSTGDLLCAKSL